MSRGRQHHRHIARRRGINRACVQGFQQGSGTDEIRPLDIIGEIIENPGCFRFGLEEVDLIAQDKSGRTAFPGPTTCGEAKRGKARKNRSAIRS